VTCSEWGKRFRRSAASVRTAVLCAAVFLPARTEMAPARADYSDTQGGNRIVPVGGEAAVLGDANAPVTLVYFTDYYCTFCRKFEQTVLPDLRDQLVKSGRLRIVMRDLPLRYGSAEAAQAARCAGEQGKYWEFHDALFSAQNFLATSLLPRIAVLVGLDSARFRDCQRSEAIHDAVAKDRDIAWRAAIPGTPAFVLGRESAGLVTGRLFMGAQPLEAFKAAIDSAVP